MNIKDEPLSMPYKYDDRTRKFYVCGQFCSWECIKSYNLHENKRNFGEIQNNVTLMRMRMYGGKPRGTRCAPSRYILKKFGGELTDDEYRAHVTSMEPHLIVSMPDTERFIQTSMMQTHQVHESCTGIDDPTQVIKDRRLAEINSTGTRSKTESLRLKRPMPIKLNKNNIENALGLIRKPTY